MTTDVLRWGQSAYETDLDLGQEEAGAQALGLTWSQQDERSTPDLSGVRALVVTSRVRVDAALLQRFSGDLVLTTTSGHDHIDVPAAWARGVRVGRCPLARRDPVVEQSLGALIGLLRRQPALQDAARAGRWARGDLPSLAPVALRGATVLIIGLGVIGRRMAAVLRALDAEVWGIDPAGVPDGIRAVTLDEGLAGADAVTVHSALTPSSRGLFGAGNLAAMRPGAVLVNTARGAVVDPDAAVAAVRSGHLRGVALDVFPAEPWPGMRDAAEVPGVWLTPHAAGYDRGLGARVASEVNDALAAWVAGKPLPHPVR